MADTPVETPGAPARAAKKTAAKKAMSKSTIVGVLADKVGITKKQSAQYLDEFTKLALKEARNGFTIPGLGKVVVAKRKARKITLAFGEHKGEIRNIPASKKLVFRFAKPAKDSLVPAKK